MSKKTKSKKETGEFTSSIKFIEFVGGKGYINYLSNEATIEGKYLSGLQFNELTFKLKIYQDGSLDFTEVGTNQTSKEERKRLIQIIEEQTISSYRNRMVINELPFTSVEKVKEKNVPLYLVVDQEKPIQKLSNMLEENIQLRSETLDNLNKLLETWLDGEELLKQFDDLDADDDMDVYEESIEELSSYVDNLQESFSKMKIDKLDELKREKSKKELDLIKHETQLLTTKNSISQTKQEINLLNQRISDLQPPKESNGYYFFVSERKNEKIELDEQTEKIIRDKVSKVKSINLENFMKLFTDGEFHIRLAKSLDEDNFDVVKDLSTLPSEIQEDLKDFDLTVTDDVLVYTGDFIWSQIVNEMIKRGFQENVEFNKFCGSNSYQSSSTIETI